MNNDLLNLEPKVLWKNFRELTLIPRPSKKEEKIRAFMLSWAKERNLEAFEDDIKNIIIRKPATAGFENRRGVILQAHLDMVPQKNSDKNHDFEKDPITTVVDGDWVRADKTTLGSDNGIGVAAAMSVLESTDLAHGPIEALFTIDEETGMTGAFNLKPGILQGDILLNLDSEDEGELYIGCAGGIDIIANALYQAKDVSEDHKAYKLSVSGLKGGHSGIDIPLQRGNANKLLFRFLQKATQEFKIRLSKAEGGNMRNAIPRESEAIVTVPSEHSEAFLEAVIAYEKLFKSELKAVEPNLSFKAEHQKLPKSVLSKSDARTLYATIRAIPHGPVRFLDNQKDIPETSTNMGIVKVGKGEIYIANLVRSSGESQKEDLACRILSIFQLAGYDAETQGGYPGWQPNFDSPILESMKGVYNSKFGKIPEIKIIHAGLECGILGSIYPNWDMISFGPTIRHPHSPDEKVNIESVGKFWTYLTETLCHIPTKA